METIVLHDLTIGYRNRRHAPSVVASGISAAVTAGKLTCLLGANGVGKSTLLRTLAGFQPKLSGDILLQGRSIDGFNRKELSHFISVVLTEKPDVTNMTAAEVVGLGRSPYTGFWGSLSDEDKKIVTDSMCTTGIGGMADRMIQTLSDGERQKVMIAKALAQQTPVIILDEPTAYLDFPSKVEMMQILKKLARQMQKTVFLSTHDLEITLQVADELWLMDAGGKLHIGSPEKLAAEGVLGHFVERSDIEFDARNMRIKIV